MKLSVANLRLCLELAERIGKVTDAHFYNEDFISVEGCANDGQKFTVTLDMKEAKQDA